MSTFIVIYRFGFYVNHGFIHKIPGKACIAFLAFFLLQLAQAEVLPFHTYTIKDGLPANQINCLYQDSRGYLWIGTTEGVSIFDGTTFTNYSQNDGLAFSFVNCITESKLSPGTIYIGTNGGGVSTWKDGTFTTLRFGETLFSNNVNSVFEDRKGRVWLGTDSVLWKLEPGANTPSAFKLPQQGVGAIIQKNNGDLWLAGSKTITVISEGDEILKFISTDLSREQYIRYFISDGERKLWFGATDGRIFEINDTSITIDRQLGFGAVQFMLRDNNDHFWIGTEQGLLYISMQELKNGNGVLYTKEHGLPDNFLNSALLDSENNLWFGSFGKGLSRLSDQTIRFFPLGLIPPLGNNNISAVDANEHLWVATPQALWELWKDTTATWRQFYHQPPRITSNPDFTAIMIDTSNRLWISYADGSIVCYTINGNYSLPSTLRYSFMLEAGKEAIAQTPLCLLVDSKERLWCSYQLQGAAVFDIATRKRIGLVVETISDNPSSIRTMFEDSGGDIWLGDFRLGIVQLEKGDIQNLSVHYYTVNEGLPHNTIRAITGDNEGNIWVGSRYGGLAKLSPQEKNKKRRVTSTFSTKDGLLTNSIWCLTSGEENRLWIGTHSGLQYLDEASSTRIGYNSDLIGNQVRSAGVVKGKYVWATTIEGLFIYEYPKSLPDTIAHPVFIKQFMVNDRIFSLSNGQELGHDQNNCSLEYIAVSLRHGASLLYKYRLLDIENEWHTPTRQREITYALLQPGTYTFEVKSITEKGIESAPTAFQFTIVPPFWKQWWFILMAGVFLSALLFLIYRYRVARLLEIERLRIRIASDLHDDVGSTLTKITVHSELIQSSADREEMNISLQKIGTMSRELVTTMSDIVWSIDARNDTVGDLYDRMEEFAQEVCLPRDIEVSFHTQGLPLEKKLPVDLRQNIYFIFKEAMNNVVKYSGATKAVITFANTSSELTMTIEDNGKGLGDKKSGTGHGFRNMRMRAERIKGRIEILSNNGTTVIVKTSPL